MDELTHVVFGSLGRPLTSSSTIRVTLGGEPWSYRTDVNICQTQQHWLEFVKKLEVSCVHKDF